MSKIIRFIKKEIVLVVALVCALFTMLFVPVDASYIEYIDVRTLCLLWCLMAVVAGIKGVGAFDWLTYQLLCRIKNGKVLSITFILLPFFCSMFVTNDVALIVFVPFTLGLLEQLDLKKAIIPIVAMIILIIAGAMLNINGWIIFAINIAIYVATFFYIRRFNGNEQL